jgi:SAM-dependent methyltransferase
MSASARATGSSDGDVVVRSRGVLRGLFAEMKPGRVLDVPAGDGEQSRALERLGFEVISIDLFPRRAAPAAGKLICADASTVLPFRSGTFDYLLCREGIEHLEDQMGFVRECARVLAPGGVLVLTTPNVMHLAARFSAAFSGQRNLHRGLINEVQTLRGQRGGRYYHGHAFLLDYFRARYMLRIAGFERLQVFTDRMSATSLALAPLAPMLWLAMKLAVVFSARNSHKPGHKPPPRDVTSEIIHHVISPALLFGRRMIIVARRAA